MMDDMIADGCDQKHAITVVSQYFHSDIIDMALQ
jgi:hypothetical protein